MLASRWPLDAPRSRRSRWRIGFQKSVEQRVVELQARKRKLMEQAFGRGSHVSREQRIEDLKLLFA